MNARRLLVSSLLVFAAVGAAATVAAQSGYEPVPTLRAADLVPAALLKGPRYSVASSVPVRGLLARFSIQSDFGTFEAAGVEMLHIRIAEIAALETLEKTSKTEEFVKAAGTAAARPIKAGAHMVMNPGETVKGVGAGLSRFYDRMKMGASSISEAGNDSSKSETEKAEDVSKRIGSVTIDVLGWEEERRTLAKKLGVDPYTTNPVLSEKLSDYAWVTFSGRVGLNALVSVVVPISMVMTATSITNDMVWDLKPADVLKANAEKLAAMGATQTQVQALLKNQWFSLTILTWLTNGLAELEGVVGRADLVAFAATAKSEEEARFIAASVNMLAVRHKNKPLATVAGHGTLVGRTQAGAVLVPAPVDYIAWTQNVATFANRPDFKSAERGVWTTGKLSPRATQEMTALGWSLNTVPQINPPAVVLPTTSR